LADEGTKGEVTERSLPASDWLSMSCSGVAADEDEDRGVGGGWGKLLPAAFWWFMAAALAAAAAAIVENEYCGVDGPCCSSLTCTGMFVSPT